MNTYIDGFDPSAPLRYSTSHYGFIVGAVVVVCALVIGFALYSHSRSYNERPLLHSSFPAVVGACVLAVALVAIPVSPLSPQRFNACQEASRWSEGRYGITLNATDCKNLFEGTGFLGMNRNTMLDSGEVVRAKKVSGKIVLTDEMGKELPRRGIVS